MPNLNISRAALEELVAAANEALGGAVTDRPAPSVPSDLHMLASLYSTFGVEQMGLDGYALCGCQAELASNQPCQKWNQAKNDAAEPNVLITAARWLKGGVAPQQMIDQLKLEGRDLTLEQIDAVAAAMRHYGLLA